MLQRSGNGLQSIKGSWGNHLGPFQGSLTNLGAPGRLQSQIQAILGQILTFPDPPCQLGQLKWSQMACTGVPQIVLHILCSTRTYWGHFRPCKVSFSALAERSSLLLRQSNFENTAFRLFSSNVLYETCPMHQ